MNSILNKVCQCLIAVWTKIVKVSHEYIGRLDHLSSIECTSLFSSVTDAKIKDETVLVTFLPVSFLGISHTQEVSEIEDIGNSSEQHHALQ